MNSKRSKKTFIVESGQWRVDSYDYLKTEFLYFKPIQTMMERKESPLQAKSEVFAGRIIKLYHYLTKRKCEDVMSKQIYRSGTSIGANIAESRNAQSTADFISKLSIALKESDETEYWLKNLHQTGFINDKEFESLHNDNIEIIKMLTSSIKTIKKKKGIL